MPIRCRSSFARRQIARKWRDVFTNSKATKALRLRTSRGSRHLKMRNKSDATTIAKLQEERDQAKAAAEKAAAELAKNERGQGSECTRRHKDCFWLERSRRH